MIRAVEAGEVGDDGFDDQFVALLDSAMLECAPGAARLLAILEWFRGVPLCLSSSEAWGSGFVEGAVAEHREQDVDALAGQAEQCLGVGLPAGPAFVVVGAGGGKK
jgi:hypothetical protein